MDASFRTKSGRTLVDRERLEIIREGARGRAAQSLQGNGTRRIWVLYAVLGSIFLLQGAIEYLRSGSLLFPIPLWAVSAWVLFNLYRSRDHSTASVLLRADVSRVQLVRGLPFLTLDHIVVHLREEGRKRRRFILLPGFTQKDREETDKAMKLLAEHGWPTDGAPPPQGF